MLTGGRGNDSIRGGDGRVLIVGERGADVLTGGNGADTFQFDSYRGRAADTITDFDVGQDKLLLIGMLRGGAGSHSLPAQRFEIGT